jgi:hypothetical protein
MSLPPAQLVAPFGLDPESYVPHLLHSPERCPGSYQARTHSL